MIVEPVRAGALPNPASRSSTLSTPARPDPAAGRVGAVRQLASSSPRRHHPDERQAGTVSAARIKKSLPASYTTAFPFERPGSTDFAVGDGYGCALRAQSPGLNHTPARARTKSIAWGQILSYALRQPQLALALGLSTRSRLPVPDVNDGGWPLRAASPRPSRPSLGARLQANPDTVKSYAARIPALGRHPAGRCSPRRCCRSSPTRERPGRGPTRSRDYDDGFAQVVHCNQPTTVDAATATRTRSRREPKPASRSAGTTNR